MLGYKDGPKKIIYEKYYFHNDFFGLGLQVGVFMVWVPEPKEISVPVPEISDRQNGKPYPSRNIQVTEIQVPKNFGSGFWLPNNPFFLKYFFPNNFVVSII